MGISATSTVAANLQQLAEVRRQQIEVDLEVGESIRRARQQIVDQTMQDGLTQAQRVNEIKKAGLQAHGGIDVWA